MSGRGRGRGRGGPLVVARDDEGNAVELKAGPPPLFPTRYTALLRDRKSSPFYLEHVAASTGVGRFKDLAQRRSSGSQTGAKTPKQQQQALANAMTLSPFYYPEELYSNKDQQASSRAAERSAWDQPSGEAGDTGLQWLDHLAELERTGRGEAAGGGEGGAEGEKKEGDDDEEEQEGLELEDDGVDGADDDYNQGFHVDDDEGYDDPYADAGDDEPVY